MREELQNKENANLESQLLAIILMDLVERELLTPDEAEHAKRIYTVNKTESKL